MVRFRNFLIALFVVAFLICGSLLTPGLADNGPEHRVRNLNFGVSGGNVNDITKRFCCSGTLGALVTDGTNQYILSNNHVLGRSGNAVAGEDVSQPGRIDLNCNVGTIVADFTLAPALGPSNVDAAIAQLRAGQMESSGAIEDIGIPSSATVNASVGLSVAKSGRTTGFTTGSVTSTNTSVSVQYQANCGSGKKFTVSYTNQIVIGGSSFSAGGDSGSLIVTNNAAHNPVGLLYAGSSTSTIANPISHVLAALSAALGDTVSIVGSGGGGGSLQSGRIGPQGMEPFTPGARALRELPQQASDRASAVLENHRANLMFQPGVIGAGVGAASDDNLQAAIVVYVDRTSSARPQLLSELDGIPVRVVLTDPFVAF
jgi:hypothetical protein